MGYSLSWLAVQAIDRQDLLAALELETTGAREEIAESDLVMATLPGDWHIVLSNRDERFDDTGLLERLSRGREIIACFVEEHVMYSEARGFSDGKLVWSVIHDAQAGLDHLETEGTLPASYAGIRERIEHQRRAAGEAPADFLFDVPIELAKMLTGFRHDEDITGDEAEPFEVLASRSTE